MMKIVSTGETEVGGEAKKESGTRNSKAFPSIPDLRFKLTSSSLSMLSNSGEYAQL